MKKGIRRVIVLLLALSMVFTTTGLPAFADTSASGGAVATVQGTEDATLESVLERIGALSNDPRNFTADDQESIEALFADYNALSSEDQATVDSTFKHPSGDGQSYGRVLEAALWAVRSFNTDTRTTLANGTYTTTSETAVSSMSDKGKSDSSRVRQWWVDRVVVDNGQATAYIYVTSGTDPNGSKLSSYPSVWVGGQSIPLGTDNTYEIPVDLNGTTYFGGVSSSMPRPIMYALDTTIEEPAAEEDADYSAVEAAIAAIPADLSIYTDESVQALNAAVDAVVRGKKASEQDAVDAMAAAINAAIAALEEKTPAPSDETVYTGDDIEFSHTDKDFELVACDKVIVSDTGAVAEIKLQFPDQIGIERIAQTTKEPTDTSHDLQFESDSQKIATVMVPVTLGEETSLYALDDAFGDWFNTKITVNVTAQQPDTPEVTELEIENEQAMFKAVSASLETYPDGSRVLVFALSGTGYIGLYKGTYPEAVQEKDAIVAALEANESTEKTIVYQENEDGKYEFRIPLDEGQTYIPLISVSSRGFQNRATQPIEEKGFYARQVELQNNGTKMWLGDYNETSEFTLSTELDDFKAETAVSTTIKGGPVNNNYSVAPTITMLDGTYDSVTYPSVVNNAVSTKAAALEDGKFVINMENAPNKKAFQDKTPLTFTFHVAEDAPYAEAGTDVERTVTFDQIAKTVTVEGTALTPKTAPVLADGTYTATKVSTDVTTDASGMIMVTKATVVIKDGQATAIVTMKGDGADRLYISDTATKDTIISEAVAEEAKEIDGQFSNLIGCYKMEGESAYSFWPIPIELGTPKIYAARSASHFNKWDTPREKYFYVHDFQIDAADLVRVSDSTDIMSPEIDAEVLVNQFYVNNGISSNHASVIKAKNTNVTVPYYDGDTKISSFNFKRPDASEYVSGWFIDDDGLSMLSSKNKNKIRYPGFTNAFTMTNASRDAGKTFTATLKLYPADTSYYQYDASEVYYYTDSDHTTPAEPVFEKTFTVTVEDKPQIDFNVGVTVTDQKSGDAIAEPVITVTDESDDSVVTPNEDGTYKLNALKKYTVAASADGYVAQGGAAQATKTGFSPSKEGEIVSLKLLKESEASHTLTFSFTDQFDEAVVNPVVKVTKYGTTEEVAANADGSYTLWDSEEYRYEATAEGYKTETGYLRLTEDSAESVKMNKYLSEYKVTYTIRDQVTDEVIENPTLVLTNNTDGTTIPQNEDGSFTVPADKSITCVASKENYQSEEFTTVTDSSINFEPEIKYSFSLEHSYKWQLADEISAAQEYAVGMVESDKPGEWETGSKAALEAAIKDAQTAHDKADATEEDFEEALKTLKAAEKAAANAQHWFEANVTVRVNKTPGKEAELYKIKVSGEASKTYKYAEPAKVGKQVSFIDVLVALHEEIYGDAFKAEPTKYFDSQNVGFYYIGKLFELGNYYQFAINGDSTGSYQNCIVKDGDVLDVSLLQRTNDIFLAFDQLEAKTKAGSEYTTTLHEGVSAQKPAEGYTVTYADAEGHEVSGVTDAEGNLTVTFEYDGEYTIKSVVTEDASKTLVQPYQKVTAEQAADYTAVDKAIASIPEDLSPYTEVTVQAVNDAVAAVDRTKTASDQADVDEMAKAIEDAVAALKEQPVKFSYDGQDVSFIKKAGSQFGMLTPQDGTTVSISGNNVVIHYVPKNKTTYGGFNWGSVDMLKYGDETVNPGYDVAFNDDGTMDLTVSKDYCGYAHPIAVVKRSFSKNTWTSADQYYLAIPALKYFDADYSAVEAAKAKVPADLSIYTDASAQAVVKAVAAVIGGKKADEQAAVDAMAQAIEDAVAALKVKTGWQQEGGNWHYYSNGKMLKNAWAKANQGWCWMDANGNWVKNQWVRNNGTWYYIKSSGYMAANEWVKSGGKWYYTKASGAMAANEWVKSGGKWYYVKASGVMAANEWVKSGSQWYYMKANGSMAAGEWIKPDGNWYYLKSNGAMATGRQTIGGRTYTFASSGRWVR